MAALSGNNYNATTDATGSVFLLDFGATATSGFAIPTSYSRWEGWYYDGKRYNTKKEATIVKNRDLSVAQVLEMRYNEIVSSPCGRKPHLLGKYYHIMFRPRTGLSRRQIAVHKRKRRLHEM